jgi:alkaline phosphatase D
VRESIYAQQRSQHEQRRSANENFEAIFSRALRECLRLPQVVGMNITRRHFLTASLVPLAAPVSAAISTTHPASAKDLPPVEADGPVEGPLFLRAGPMLGHVAHDRAILWVKASNDARVSIRLWEGSIQSQSRLIPGPSVSEATGFCASVEIPDLKPATRYFYSVLFNDEVVSSRPSPSFVTTQTPGAAGVTRLAFVSCSGYRGYMAAAAWGDMAARANFDVILQLGDNHYANTPDLAIQRAYYRMHREVAGFRGLTASVPCVGVWDDHDFGPNDSDGTLPGKENALRAFKEAWANPSFGEPENPGCYFKFTRGDVDFFMLDVRYHRSPDKAEKNDAKTMLGAKQFEWLKRELSASKAKLKFIAGGSVIETGGPLDSWASYPAERKALLDFVRDMEGVIFLSGDRHFSAGYQVEGRFIEATSGPLGSGNANCGANPEIWVSCSEGKMWSIFEVDTTGATPKVAYELWHATSGMTERRELTWDEVNGRAKIPPSPPLPKPPAPRKK